MQQTSAFAAVSDTDAGHVSLEAAEAANIIGVTPHVMRALALREKLKDDSTGSARKELLWHKSLILKKLLLAYLEVRQTSDAIDIAIDYTYDGIDKESRKRDLLVTLSNIANFSQFGILYSMGALCRQYSQFKASAVLTTTAGGNSLLLSALSIKLAGIGKSKAICPPNTLAGFFDLQPPIEYQLPDMVEKFVNAVPSGATQSRKLLTLATWNSRFHLDISNRDLLQNLAAYPQMTGGEPIGLLRKRLVLLYSLNALVEQFDDELLALLRLMETPDPSANDQLIAHANIQELNPEASEAATLLGVQPQALSLIALQHSQKSPTINSNQLQLEILMLEKILGGALEVRKVVDRIDREKHYQFDVVLAEMTGSRDRALRINNVLNFSQTGILKEVAGPLYIKGQAKAGTELLMLVSSGQLLLSTIALKEARGAKRHLDSDTNVLSDVLGLDPPASYRLSPLMRNYLNKVPPNSGNTKTRLQQLTEHWQQHRLFDTTDTNKMNQLAAMPSLRDQRCETIKLVEQRLRMLFDVRAAAEGLDAELLDLLHAID